MKENIIKFEITAHLATLSTSPTGWTKELNFISWNDKEVQYPLLTIPRLGRA